MAMDRSIAVRYTASMGALLRDLGLGAKANEKLADASDKAAAKVEANAKKMASSYKPTAQAMRASLEDQRKAQAKFDADQKSASEAADASAKKRADRMAVGAMVVAAGFGAAVAKFAEFDAQMSAAAAATGATGDELTTLRDAAVKAGADTQYSATEAATAITELSKAGLDATQILGGGLTGALNLAAAGQMAVGDAAETMATGLAQFHLDGSEASHVADLLAAGAGKAQGSVADMGMALKQSGLVAANTGLSIEETTAALTAMANAGLIGSDAGTSLKTMLQRLTPQSDQAAGMMDELGISAYDAQGKFIGLSAFAENLKQSMQDLTPQQRNAAMSIIFGSDAVRGATVLYNEGAAGIDKWTEATNQTGFAARQAATLTDNLKGDIERLGGSFDTALIQSGSGANDVLRSMTQAANSLVDGLGKIPGPVVAGAAAFGSLMLLGPKVAQIASTVTGPLTTGMTRFRDEMKLQQALANGLRSDYDGLGEATLRSSDKVSRSSKAMGAARAAMGGVKGAAGGLMSMLGGPWGIALAGATTAVAIWAQKQADARAAADALNATIDKQTDAFTGESKTTVMGAFADALAPEDLKRVQELGVNLGDAADMALKGGPAFEDYKQHLLDLQREKAGLFGSSDARLLEAFTNALEIQGVGADQLRAKLELLRQEKNNQLIADSRGAGSAAAAERNMDDLGTTTDKTAGAMQDGKGAAEGMGDGLDTMGGKAKDAKTELEGLMNYIDGTFGSGERAIRGNQRAFDSAVREASDAAKDAAKAGGKGYADADAVKAQKRAQDELDKARAAYSKEAKKRDKKGKAPDLSQESDRVKRAEENLADANQRVKDTWHDATKAGEAYHAKLEDIADAGEKQVRELIKQNRPIKDLNAAYDQTRAALIKVINERGIHGKAAEDEADKIFATTTAMDDLRFQYANTQAQVATEIKTPGLPEAKAGVKGYYDVINGVPTFKPFTPTTPGLPKAKGDVDNYVAVINGVPQLKHTDVSVTVSGLDELRTAAALVSVMPGAFGVSAILNAAAATSPKKTHSAAGNIVTAYAAGGLDAPNSHVAEIATAGTRMWAEPETQGELYAPLANDWRRPRAKALVSQVVSRFGGQVSWHAAGSITASSLQPAGGGLTPDAVRAIVAGMPRMSDRDIDRTGAAFARKMADMLPRAALQVNVADVQAAAMER